MRLDACFSDPHLPPPPGTQALAGRKVLVTGATGFLGSRLVEALGDAGADVTAVVRGLTTPLLQREELVTQVDERVRLASAAELESEQPAVEGQRLVDVAHFERDVVEADRAGFPCCGHEQPPIDSFIERTAGALGCQRLTDANRNTSYGPATCDATARTRRSPSGHAGDADAQLPWH